MIAAHHSMLSAAKSAPLLPDGYVELPFVNTNGDTVSGDAKKVNSAAAFNTGFTPSAATVVETSICPGDNGTGEWETFIGGSDNGDARTGAWLLRRWGHFAQFCFSVNAWVGDAYASGARSSEFINATSWVQLRIRIGSVVYRVDGAEETVSVPHSQSFSGVAPIWIGASGRKNYSNSYRGCKALFGRTTITEGGVLVRDYIPARRTIDSVCGFYDLVAGEFKPSEVPNHVFTADGY